jgi:N-acetylmuramate 1-kinase
VNHLPENILDLARGTLSASGGFSLRVIPLQKGGSDRHFYRVIAGSESLIIVSYTGHREENRHYVAIGEFLHAAGVHVPKVHYHDPMEGLIFLQDLGDIDLWTYRDGEPRIRIALYEAALRQAVQLHGPASRATGRDALHLQLEFDSQLYLWEQNYFFEHCLGRFFGLEGSRLERMASLDALHKAAGELASLPRCLVHRDLQSQNIMVKNRDVWFIDFQGMRPGLPHYDIASLLYDPYASISAEERNSLISWYVKAAAREGIVSHDEDTFRRTLDLCAMQRLMQAMGAYGFLGLERGRPEFLAHIPTARHALCDVLERIEGTEDLLHTLNTLH